VRWFAETDLSIHEDPELLTLMSESGCAEVLIGLESPTEEGLEGIELRSNWKRKRWHEYEQAIGRIQSHGIRVNGCFVLGLDGHGARVFDDVYDFADRCGLFDVQITVATPFPGTPLYHRLKRENRLLRDGAWELCTLFDVNFQPRGMTVEQLRSGFRQLAVRLYGDEPTRRRRETFHRQHSRRIRVRQEVR
jgi:radical SAM superfamily enzyme YgiQ (UPF0313 family)